MIMAVIGIDSHKDVLTGCLVDASGVSIEQRSIANTTAGHAELVAWARSAGVQRVGIEGAGNYGRPATVALIGAGVPVVEVPPQMTAAARRRRRTRTKTDPVDALEIARISARDDDLPPPRFVGACDDLAALVRYRRELVKSRTAALNRLHSTLGGWCQIGVWRGCVGWRGRWCGVGAGGVWWGVCSGLFSAGVLGRCWGVLGVRRVPIGEVLSAARARRGARCSRLLRAG